MLKPFQKIFRRKPDENAEFVSSKRPKTELFKEGFQAIGRRKTNPMKTVWQIQEPKPGEDPTKADYFKNFDSTGDLQDGDAVTWRMGSIYNVKKIANGEISLEKCPDQTSPLTNS